MRSQPLPWVTSQDRIELDIGGAQQRDIADGKVRTRNLRIIKIHAKVLVLEACQIGAGLNLHDAGNLPAIGKPSQQLVLGGVRQLNRVSGVKQVGTIVGQ